MYPGRHDIFFHTSSSPSTPYQPLPSLVTRYKFNEAENDHVICNTCGCQIFESREAKEGDEFEGWEEENGDKRDFGLNVALMNWVEEWIADGKGEVLKGLKRNERQRWKEPVYELRL